MSFTPKNWTEFQHYKDRSPVWIKLHRRLLDDFDFNRLPLASRALAPMLWLLASEYEGGNITASVDEIAFRLRVGAGDVAEALKPLIEKGFFASDSDMLAGCYQGAIPEKRERTSKRQRRDISTRTNGAEVPEEMPDESRAYAEGKGWDDRKSASEWERFRNHSLANGKTHRNVNAAWRNWVTSPFQSKGEVNGTTTWKNGREPSPITTALDRRIKQFGDAARDSGEVCETTPRLLSDGRR